MVNVQFGDYNPSEEPKDSTEYVYYTREGEYLGGIAGSAKIFLTTKENYDKAAAAKKWEDINVDSELVKYKDKAMTHSDFRFIAYVVMHEAGNSDLKELRCIAYTSHNRSESTKQTWRVLLNSSYSSVESKTELPDKNDDKSKLTRQAELDVLKGVADITNGAEFWDGTDFLAWGNSEQNPYNKTGQNKFDEYKFIEIPKGIYDDFLAAQGTTSTTYGDKGNHDLKHDHGTHEHISVKTKKGEKKKLKYDIPAAEFNDQQYWTSGSFYYDTGAKVKNGLSATITAGKSIFWKITATRLTSATAQPGQTPGQGQGQPPPQPGGQSQQPGGQGQPQQPGQQPGQPQRPGGPPQQPPRPGGPPGQPPRPGGPPGQPPRPGGGPPFQPPHQ